MSSFTKFATAAVLAVSLAPFAAQARSGSIGTVIPQQNQAAQQTASVNSHANVRVASNEVNTTFRHVGGAATDSYSG